MDEATKPIKIGYYLDILSRRRWYVILPFCLVMVVGIYLAITLPKIYEAETLILIQPQKVPANFVQPVVSSGIETRITTIAQQIMSRSNLEQIIEQFNLFMDPEHDGMHMEAKVENMRGRISVDVISQRRRPAEAFSIAVMGKNPEKVMHITNALAARFIDENLKFREDEATGTSDFLEDELQAMRARLEQLEQKLKQYREANMGGLPEQLDTNLRILDRLQAQLSSKQENLRDAKNRLISLNNQITETESLQQSAVMSSSTGSDEIETDPYLKLQKMKVELDDLSSRYTPKHPDVIRMKNMIADLERKIENGTIQSSGASESKTHVPTMNPVFAERRSLLMQQRVETNLEIRNLNADAARLLNQIAHYQKLVEDTPKKEQELLSLQRDYNNMNNNYKSLLDRKMQAQLAVNLEKKKKGEQFRILDRAQFPFTPVEPDMKKLFMLILVASVGLGGGLVFLLEYFDNSVRQVKDLESDLGITVLASIPKIYTKKDKVKYGFNKVLTYACLAVALVLCAGFAALVLNGVESTLELVQSFAKL